LIILAAVQLHYFVNKRQERIFLETQVVNFHNLRHINALQRILYLI
jgi:hypothetical protein